MPRPKSFNKEQVLESAMRTFWKQGYDGTSMKDLELSTQLTPGSLYHEFGSKTGIFKTVLNFYIDTLMLSRVNHYLTSDADPLLGIRNFVVSAFKGVPKTLEGDACLLVNTATELGKSNPEINQIVKRGFRLIENALKQQFIQAQEVGQVRNNLDCEAAAKQLIFLMSGLLVASKTQGSTKALESTVDFTLTAYH